MRPGLAHNKDFLAGLLFAVIAIHVMALAGTPPATAVSTASGCLSSNTGSPDKHSARMRPRAQMSVIWSMSVSPSACSGLMYAGVPKS